MSGLLQLNKAERALLLYGTLARYQRDLRSILVEFKVNNAPEAYAAIAEMAGVNATEVGEALRAGSRLERIGLVENLISEHNITDLADLMKVSEKLPPVLMREYRDQNELMAVFTRPSAKSALALHDFCFVEDDAQVLVRAAAQCGDAQGGGRQRAALRAARHRQDRAGQGGRAGGGTGTVRSRVRGPRRQLAQSVATAIARCRSRRCSSRAARRPRLLFDEVEDVFPPISSEAAQLMARAEQVVAPPNGSVSGKAWVNQILESNAVPTIWVTNRIEQIDPAFRRRFAYHLELKSPPPGAREGLVRKTLEGVTVSEAFVGKLTERKGLTPAQIRTAVRFAGLASADGSSDGKPDRAATAQRRPGAGQPRPGRRRAPQRHHLRPGHAERGVPLRGAAHRRRRSRRAATARCASTARPGTGKTALAEHIAKSLDRPLLIKQASDLMSKFVGETEQNMAAMFREAENEKAVLLLDEADSFLQDRRGAQRTYEVTEVNEMLQGMERFNGIFVCTTNLMDRIDQAALRRFTFKIRFKPLTAVQREKMFVTEALGGDAALLTDQARARLLRLEQLCPGDFAAVKRQVDILAAQFGVEEFLEQLEAEHRIKPEVREARSIGFLQ